MSTANLDIKELLKHLQYHLKRKIEDNGIANPLLIGIHTGGAWIAQHLHEKLSIQEPLGLLDISFYRDDFSRIGMHPQVKPSQLPFSVEGRDILLVDDVLFTGRTIRAALNKIFDYGRPARVMLIVLIDRDGREIPIQADCYGARVTLQTNERIKLAGPAPLELSIRTVETH